MTDGVKLRTSPSVLVATVILAVTLPVATFVAINSGLSQKENDPKNAQSLNSQSRSGQDAPISTVPEVNPVLVMVPFIGVVALFASAQFRRTRRKEA